MPETTAKPSPPFAFDGVVRLTGIGGGFLIFTVLVGFAAINTGNNSLYIGLTFLLGCLLLSGLASKGGLRHMTIEFGGVSEAWAGRPADGTLNIQNASGVWNVRDLVIASDELAEPILIPMIRRHAEYEAAVRLVFPQRGLVQLKRIDLYTRYPFGLFLKKRKVRLTGEVVVYPRLLDVGGTDELFRKYAGENSSSHLIGPGTELHGFRPYVRGDSLRSVHWKKSATLGQWLIKQTDAEAANVVHVAVDPYLPPGMEAESLEHLISEAATCIHDALERGHDVVLSLPRVTLRGTTSDAGREMFRALALLENVAEPTWFTAAGTTILFALRRGDESKSA